MNAKKRRAGETAKAKWRKTLTAIRATIPEGRKVMTAVRDCLRNNEEQRARAMRALALLDKLEKKIAELENEIS